MRRTSITLAGLATLLVVHLSNDPGSPFLDWLGVVRRIQLERYRWTCDRHAEFPQDFASVPQEVIENAIVDRLIERLRRRRAVA